MIRLEDMSETHRQAWATLIVDVTVFIFFLQKMVVGDSVNDYAPKELVGIFVGLIIVTIILHAVIASVFAVRKRSDDTELKDERDIKIERKGASYGFYFLAVVMNIMAGQLLLETSITDYQGVVTMTNTSHLFFVLVSAAFIGDIIKNGVMVLSFRGE